MRTSYRNKGLLMFKAGVLVCEFNALPALDILKDWNVTDLTISMVPPGVCPQVPHTAKLHIHFLAKPRPGDLSMITRLSETFTWSSP
jgi:hypothetical protein